MSGNHPAGYRSPAVPEILGLAAILAIGYILPAFTRALWNPDEPRIAHIGLSMARPGGDLVVPRVNGEPFVQEPPLCHWLVALSFLATGTSPGDDWVPRLPSMVFAIATVLLVLGEGRRVFGPRAGFFAALVLATMAEYVEVANRAGTDVLVTFFVALGAFQAIGISSEEVLSLRRALAFGLAAGLSFLSKNLLGPTFLSLVLLALLATRRDLLRQRRTWIGAALGLSAFLAVVLPWLVLLASRDPSLLGSLLVDNTIGRFLSSDRHDPALLVFAGNLLGDWLPWTPVLFPAVAGLVLSARRPRKNPGDGDAGDGDPDRFSRSRSAVLLAWIALPTLLVLSSGSKRDLYLLSVCPALALAAGRFLDRAAGARWTGPIAAAVVILAGILLPAMALVGGLWVRPVPAGVFVALAAHLFFLYRWARRKERRSPDRTLATAVILTGLVLVAGNLMRCRIEDGRKSYVPIAAELADLDGRGWSIAGYRLGLREVSAVGYYLGRSIPNLQEAADAEALLAAGGSPAAVVVEKRVLESEGTARLKEAPHRTEFDRVSRGLVVLRNGDR